MKNSGHRGSTFELGEGCCFTLPPAGRINEDKLLEGTSVYVMSDPHINAVIMCMIKHQTWHWSTPANELLHLRKTLPP